MKKFSFLPYILLATLLFSFTSNIKSQTLTEGFETGLPTSGSSTVQNYTLASGVWAILKGASSSTKHSGSLALKLSGGTTSSPTYAIAPTLSAVSTVSFWVKGSSATNVIIEKSINADAYATVATQAITTTYTQYTINVNETGNNVRIEFANTSDKTLYIDDVTINYGSTTQTPSLSVTPASISFGNITVNTISTEKTYSISGANLSPASGSIIVTAPTGYQITKTSGSGYASSLTVAYSGSTLAATTVYAVFKPTAIQSYNGNITNAGGGATTQNIAVSGTGVGTTPVLSVIPTSLAFGNVTINTTSAEKRYSVSGSNLSPASGSITVTAPTSYQVTKASGSGYASSLTIAYTGGTLASTTIYAVFKPTAIQSYSGNITNAGGGAATSTVAVTGSGIQQAFGTNYYISPSGNDNNNGLFAAPWKTIKHSISAVSNYDTINILAGTFNEMININKSNIYIRNYNGSRPLVSGTGLTTHIPMFQVLDQSNITIEGLEIANNIQKDAQGILVDGNCQNITIKNCTLHDIHFSADSNAKVTSTTNAQGIIVYGSNAVTAITNLKIMNDTIYHCRLGYSEAISVNGNIDGFQVIGNVVHDVTNIGIDAEGNYGTSSNPATDHARDGDIKNNITYRCFSAAATSGGLYIDGAKNVVLENNISYLNGYGIEVGCEIVGAITDSIIVRDNIVYNNQVCGIALGGYAYPKGSGKVTNSSITNNTCYYNNYANSGYGEFYLSYSENTLMENNIFYVSLQNNLTYSEIGQVALTFNYNLFYSDKSPANIGVDWNGTYYPTLAAFKTASGTNTNSVVGNPLFVNTNITNPDFHIKAGSAAIDAGNPSFVAAPAERDMDNQYRDSGIVDCGADEYYGPAVTYNFTGNGNWSNAANWNNNIVPPVNLAPYDSIFINPVAGGQCLLDVAEHISPGASVTVNTGKNLVIPGALQLQ